MSSPIHQSDDLDPALRYAPRRVREASRAGRPLPLPPEFRRSQRAAPEFSGDRAMVELQRQLLLDPDAIPEPLVDDARTLKPIVLRLAGVLALAALIAWCIVSLPNMKKAGEIMSVDVKMPALTGAPVDLVLPQTAKAAPPQESVAAASQAASPPAIAPAKTVVASIAPTAPMSQVMPPTPSAPPAPWPAQPQTAPPAAANAPADTAAPQPHIDAAELASMIKRGKDLLASGDIVSARLLLRRAADAGNADAALALGATFDPQVIRKLGAVGMKPDVAQARQWYQRAADLGSASAVGQLAQLQKAQ